MPEPTVDRPLSADACKRLRAVQTHITKFPNTFNLEKWGYTNPDKCSDEHPCGTTACIAGWVVALEYGPLSPNWEGDPKTWDIALVGTYNIEENAMTILGGHGLTNRAEAAYDVLHSLFMFNWPMDLKEELFNSPLDTAMEEVTAEEASGAIDYYIKHYGNEEA